MIVQISAGIGGPVECEIAVGKLFESLNKEFGNLSIIDMHKSRWCDGYSSITFTTEKDVSFLEGSVKWICNSSIRPHHKRKNWFVDVSVIPEVETVCKEEDFKIERFKSSGAGGQHVNKTESGVRIIHIPTGISVTSTDERSQIQNRKVAMSRMSLKLLQMELDAVADQKNTAWKKHTELVRGNPVRVYKGEAFALIKDKK